MPDASKPPCGQVYLIGAGPGDPGLITLRGVQLLSRADVILYDYLVNPLLLTYAAPETERICLGSHGRGRIMSQEEVNRKLVLMAQEGRTVARLKGGDPALFARTAEEIDALDEAGISYEVVPGITVALAAASHVGIPLTHRDSASAVALVTGQQQLEAVSKMDFGALAGFPGTLVFYMGVTSSREWSDALMAAGKPAETPACIIRRGTWTDQQVIECNLGNIAAELETRKIRPPVLAVVGQVCSAAARSTWFTQRPLFGQTILVTRPMHQAGPLCERLGELGAGCLVQPAIEILPPQDWQPTDDAIAELDEYDWLVFSSANGVRSFLDRVWQQHGDLRMLGTVKLATIGPRTANELLRYRLRPDVTPDEYRAEALADALIADASGQRFLLARASRGREVLAERLSAAGARVDQVVVYESRDVMKADEIVASALREDHIDWITVTSSAIARSLVALFAEDLRRSRLASISPITSATLREIGFEPAVEATDFTTEGLAAAIVAAGHRA